MTTPDPDLLPAWAWPQPGDGKPLQDGPFRLAEALSWRAPDEPGDGLRLAVKENVAVAGRPLRAGSPGRDDEPPEPADAPVVARLRAAGMRLVGTVRMHELAYGVTGRNDADGTVANPRDPALLPGGSSSGSAAAVATGVADVALATDTGGSARIPAALCGVVGYKAARGLDLTGVLPLAPRLDHLGWTTRDVATARVTASALGLPETQAPQRPRFAVVHVPADPAVTAAFAEALRRLAPYADLTVVDWPHRDLTVAVTNTLMAAEASALHGPDAHRYGPDVRARLARTVTAAQEREALTYQGFLTGAWASLTDPYDAVLAVTCGISAPPLGAAYDPGVIAALVRTTRLDDLTGLPAVSLPIGPAGLHVGARTDADVLAIAARIEAWLRG